MDKLSPAQEAEAYVASLKLSPIEQEFFENLNASKHYKKGDILLREGEQARNSYYVVTGCVRQYYLIDGEEKTTNFYTEEESILSTISTINKLPSKFYLECVEDCLVKESSYSQEAEIYEKFPRFEKLCRITTEEQLGKFQERFAIFMTSSPEERYLNLVNTRPDLLNRVPQYQLASYLGIKPESLSRIRKRILGKL